MRKLISFLLTGLAVFGAEARTTATKTVEDGGSGRFKAVVCAESTLPGYTVYRPADLAAAVKEAGRLPLLVWGNGACSNSNLANERLLNEIASHGYVVVAIGPFRLNDQDGFVDSRTDGTFITKAIDWIVTQDSDAASEYRGRIDARRIATAGHSCGGAEAISVSDDSRVSTILMMNAGMGGLRMAGASAENLKTVHGPILYVLGGAGDVAYRNALADYNALSVNQPVCFMSKPVGHGGTFHEPHGGDYGRIMTAWLDWTLKGNRQSSHSFRDGAISGCEGWEIKSKNMPTKE